MFVLLTNSRSIRKKQIKDAKLTDFCTVITTQSSGRYYVNIKQNVQCYFIMANQISKRLLSLKQRTVGSEFMGKTFQAAQLTHERFLTIDNSCKIFF